MTVTVDAPHPWDVVVASPDGSSRLVAAGATMAEMFDELDQIVRELAARYEIPSPQARAWLDTDQLIPLLDGLDEVAEEYQPACVMAINDFRAQRGATRIVVCCRTADYERLRDPLRTYGTLTIQPLTRKQVEDFLARAGEPVAAARAAIAADSLLGELIQSPLLLSIAVLAYRDAPVGTVATGDDSQQLRDRLFATYVRTMLARRRSDRHSTRQTVRRLAFLAKCVKDRYQTVFTL